jgi:hypothetical protein
MSSTLIIAFTVKYDGGLLANNERSPHLMAWSSLPGRSKHFAPVFWADKRKRKSKPAELRLELPLAKRAGVYDAKTHTYRMPLDSTIGIQGRCVTPNEEGRPTIRGCGEALLPIGLALDRLKNSAAALKKTDFELQLVYHTHTNKDGSLAIKGNVVVSGMHAYLADQPECAVQLVADGALDEFSYVSANAQSFNSDVEAMMERSVAPFTDEAAAHGYALTPHTDEVKRVHAPLYSTPAGAQPGFTFVMAPRDASVVPGVGTPEHDKVRKWLHELAIYSLRRENISVKEFVACVSEQMARQDNAFDNAFVRCCGAVGQMLAIPSTSAPYIGDFIEVPRTTSLERENKTHAAAKLAAWHPESLHGYIAAREKRRAASWQAGYAARYEAALVAGKDCEDMPDEPDKQRIAVESFNELADYASGDCEDLGCLSVRICNTWARTAWNADEDPLVAAVGRVLRQYVPCLTLGSVRCAALGNDHTAIVEQEAGAIDSEADRKLSYGAHMWCVLVPVVKFLALVRRTVSDFSAVDELRRRGADFSTAPWVAALPDLNVEGTGMVTSLLRQPIAYIVTGSPTETVDAVKSEALARIETTARVYAYLQNADNSRWLSKLSVVRPQKQQLAKPNFRLTKFYRQVTHMYTDWLMQWGYSNVDFIAGYVGERVPLPDVTPATQRFETAPLIGKLVPAGAVAAAAAAAVAVARLPLIGTKDEEERKQRAAAAGLKGFRYGAALEDIFESNAALLPGTRLDARDMRIIATLQRHSPPITMPGNFAAQWKMHEARIASRLADEGIDDHAIEDDFDRRFDTLDARIRALVPAAWPLSWRASAAGTLATFIIVSDMLSADTAVEHLMEDIGKHAKSGLIVAARVNMEEPMPHIRNIVLQFICDAAKLPALGMMGATFP